MKTYCNVVCFWLKWQSEHGIKRLGTILLQFSARVARLGADFPPNLATKAFRFSFISLLMHWSALRKILVWAVHLYQLYQISLILWVANPPNLATLFSNSARNSPRWLQSVLPDWTRFPWLQCSWNHLRFFIMKKQAAHRPITRNVCVIHPRETQSTVLNRSVEHLESFIH